MKRKIRVSKTLSVILLSVALVLCAWRIWYVNATAYSFETQEYGMVRPVDTSSAFLAPMA